VYDFLRAFSVTKSPPPPFWISSAEVVNRHVSPSVHRNCVTPPATKSFKKVVDFVRPRVYGDLNIKSDSAMSTATEPARPRCFPPGDVMHESA
jgi:hypothetical protein